MLDIFKKVFSISDIGFLSAPMTNAQFLLPSSLNVEFNRLIKAMPNLLKQGSFCQEIDCLNGSLARENVAIDRRDKSQLQVAVLILSMLAQAYIWEDKENPARRLPEVIARNLHELCQQSHRFPTLTYVDYVLSNWYLQDPHQGITLENITPHYTFTGSISEEWFIKIHVMVEATCGPALLAACSAFLLLQDRRVPVMPAQKNQLIELFSKVREALQIAAEIEKRMIEHCDPDYFWQWLRLYFQGWEAVKSPTEVGVQLLGVNDFHHVYRGSSGAQSSILPALDAIFGIRHKIDDAYHHSLSLQQYMPREHRALIELLKTSVIKESIETSGWKDLKVAWQDVVSSIKNFRLAHFWLVVKYIFEPAKRRGIARQSIPGSGGTSIDNFLVGHIETALEAKEKIRV